MKCCCLSTSSIYTIQPWTSLQCHIIQSHVDRVYVCLAVTCHLCFWQNDPDLLRATAVTRGWNGYWNKSHHGKFTQANKILPPLLLGLKPGWPSDHKSDPLTTELSPLPGCENMTVSAAILCPAVCISDIRCKAGVCGKSIKYVSQPFKFRSLLVKSKQIWLHPERRRSIQCKKQKCTSFV